VRNQDPLPADGNVDGVGLPVSDAVGVRVAEGTGDTGVPVAEAGGGVSVTVGGGAVDVIGSGVNVRVGTVCRSRSWPVIAQDDSPFRLNSISRLITRITATVLESVDIRISV
jgi:hypothetical protein